MSIISILDSKIETRKIDLATNFISRIIGANYTIDQTLRSQLNYIKNHKGNLKVSSIWEKFNVSKVTLRNRFLENIGLTAKEISKIYRFNNFLTLIYKNPLSSLTQLSLEAGYYDQSHFIKEFRSFIGISPNLFLRKNYNLNISQERIERRFSSYYAPY